VALVLLARVVDFILVPAAVHILAREVEHTPVQEVGHILVLVAVNIRALAAALIQGPEEELTQVPVVVHIPDREVEHMQVRVVPVIPVPADNLMIAGIGLLLIVGRKRKSPSSLQDSD